MTPEQLQYFREKIANLAVHGISDSDIAAACGLSEAQISEIKLSSEYAKLHSEAASEVIDTDITRNDAWDTIEMLSLKNIRDIIEYNQDPDFNLRVAVMANKAQRRGHKNNSAIDGRTGEKAVITLNQTFVTKLQNHETVISAENQQIIYEKKGQDFLAPSQVENIFNGGKLPQPETPMEALEHSAEQLARMLKNA